MIWKRLGIVYEIIDNYDSKLLFKGINEFLFEMGVGLLKIYVYRLIYKEFFKNEFVFEIVFYLIDLNYVDVLWCMNDK